ncbi:hypothetical protein FJ950_22890 [Mesorhizobium sp. B2-3-14]|uniref:hypothetical protein n=1 Tax=Mesorhizobium sp. B2-3-14 TaxID=2589950 RepID=UPI00112904DB|nr:hypothetical protein [Mesorhizobium sp. B2-3-14]TPL81718.1 hypothetical protein FJ950_22890 [Mesorhizobium sp. B2-3-14]
MNSEREARKTAPAGGQGGKLAAALTIWRLKCVTQKFHWNDISKDFNFAGYAVVIPIKRSYLMTTSDWIGIAAIIVAILLAVIGWVFVTGKRKNSPDQNQNVGKGGTGIQSGRDTNLRR